MQVRPNFEDIQCIKCFHYRVLDIRKGECDWWVKYKVGEEDPPFTCARHPDEAKTTCPKKNDSEPTTPPKLTCVNRSDPPRKRKGGARLRPAGVRGDSGKSKQDGRRRSKGQKRRRAVAGGDGDEVEEPAAAGMSAALRRAFLMTCAEGVGQYRRVKELRKMSDDALMALQEDAMMAQVAALRHTGGLKPLPGLPRAAGLADVEAAVSPQTDAQVCTDAGEPVAVLAASRDEGEDPVRSAVHEGSDAGECQGVSSGKSMGVEGCFGRDEETDAGA